MIFKDLKQLTSNGKCESGGTTFHHSMLLPGKEKPFFGRRLSQMENRFQDSLKDEKESRCNEQINLYPSLKGKGNGSDLLHNQSKGKKSGIDKNGLTSGTLIHKSKGKNRIYESQRDEFDLINNLSDNQTMKEISFYRGRNIKNKEALMGKSKTTEQQLLSAGALLTNIQQDDIVGDLVDYGYGDEKFQDGMSLLSAAKNALDNRRTCFTNQLRASETFRQARHNAHRSYMDLVKLSRVALKDFPDYKSELGIDVARKMRLDLWKAQAQDFFKKALANATILTQLATYGITSVKLTEAKSKLDGLETLLNEKLNTKGLAQVATVLKNDAMTDLNKFCSGLITACRIAFRTNPQHMERFNVIIYTAGYVPVSNVSDDTVTDDSNDDTTSEEIL